MNESQTTNDRQTVITRKIQKMEKHEKGLKAIRENIQSSDIVDVIATFPADTRPSIMSFPHICHGFYDRSYEIKDYVLIPQHLTGYAVVICCKETYRGRCGHSLYFKIDPFKFTFPIQSIEYEKGIGEMVDGNLHGSGDRPLLELVKIGVKVIFAECCEGKIETKNGDILKRPITSWRAEVLEDHGAKIVHKYMDPWFKVTGGKKSKPVESDHNFDMDCHPDHIQSVIDRHEDFEYRQSMRGENLDC